MGKVQWTDEQLDAIKIRNSKTLVAAGAGSGKTAVLVERIIRKIIDDGIDIDKMLIVTFTNAAASEMKERIRDRLYDETNTNHKLQKQILYLNRSSIMTIDAFCKKAVKDYFYKIDVDPNFKIADNTDAELLKLEAIDEVLEELYESNDSDIIEVLDAYSDNKSDESLVNLIFSIHRFIASSAYPMEWLKEKCEMYNVNENDFSNTVWGKKLINYTRKTVRELLEELRSIEEDLLNDEAAKNYLLTIQDDILMLEALRKNNLTWDDYYNEFRTVEFSKLKPAPKMDEETKEYVKELRKKTSKIIKDYFKDEVFISTSDEILEDLKKAHHHALVLYEFVKLFDERFKKKKTERNLLDFSDIEHLCLKLFDQNEDVVNDYKNKYEEILIDEYQDSNLIQEYILNKIANKNIFMVGDVKQSIYKFRQARPELFLEKYNSYNMYNEESQTDENKILLFKNFRSNKNIIDAVNFIFKNIMSKETGEIDYSEEEYLKYGATSYDYDGESAELHLIEKSSGTEETLIEDDVEDKPQLEARVVAKRIEELVGNLEVYDKKIKAKRKAKYSDIVILLRSAKVKAQVFYEELSKRNIPVYTEVQKGYFDNPEVQIILSLLKIIDNPYQDIPLLAVLRSVIGGFDVNELTKIRMYDKKCSFYEAMMIAATQGDEKVRKFLDKLSVWREKSRYLAMEELLSYIYEETGYYYYVSLLPKGDRRQNNLKVLLKRAADYGKSTFKGLYNFLNFIENIKESSSDFDTPSELSETDDVVRIMSIHKSKGLEFPIVILSGTTGKFVKRDLQNRIIFHQDMGLGFDIVNPKKRIAYESIPKLALKLQNEKELLAEEMRILYVALTRAKEKIIITALTPNVEKRVQSWSTPISEYAVTTANSFADWICKVVLSTTNDWNVVKWTYNDVLSLSSCDTNNEEKDDIIKYDFNKDDYDFISGRFAYKYPYLLSTKIPSKLSVSELKRLNNAQNVAEIQKVKEVDLPKFLNEQDVKGATYGTLLHNKMENLDFHKLDVEEILSDVEDNILKSKLEKDINKFIKSPVYEMIKNAKRIRKETPFNMSVPVKDVFKFDNESNDDEIMVQGIIDLYFETDDGIVIVDYKSDKLSSEEEFKLRYAKQLEYYKKALEKLTTKKVTKTYIYSFELAREIEVENNK